MIHGQRRQQGVGDAGGSMSGLIIEQYWYWLWAYISELLLTFCLSLPARCTPSWALGCGPGRPPGVARLPACSVPVSVAVAAVRRLSADPAAGHDAAMNAWFGHKLLLYRGWTNFRGVS